MLLQAPTGTEISELPGAVLSYLTWVGIELGSPAKEVCSLKPSSI